MSHDHKNEPTEHVELVDKLNQIISDARIQSAKGKIVMPHHVQVLLSYITMLEKERQTLRKMIGDLLADLETLGKDFNSN